MSANAIRWRDAIVSPLARGGDFIRSLEGWRRALAAFVAGALSALSFAPFGIFPLLLLAIAVLVLLLDGGKAARHPHRSAFWVGWLWSFGQFLGGIYWVAYAFLVDAASHAWQIPLLEIALPGGLALFVAAASAAASFFWQRNASRIFVFAIAYAIAEWLRGHVLTGFPWNLPAYGWAASLGVLQTTALVGSYGLSLLTVLFGASLAQLASREVHACRLPLFMTALFAILWIGGDVRLALIHPADVPSVHLRLVQPDVPQKEKLLHALALRNWQRLIDLSTRPSPVSPTIVIWPEAAPPPFWLQRYPETMDEVALLTGSKRVLMTGAARVFATSDGTLHASNSLYVFGKSGRLLATYDKFHLVPLGEYTPLAPLLERLGIDKLVELPGSFVAGDGPHTYDLPNAPEVGPLICYEIIFPGEVVGTRRPQWIVNVTDDSWFGPSTGPYQHLLTARVRAIEEGLPVVRDANTGISAVIDPLGRVRTRLELDQMGVLDAGLPGAVPITPFARLKGAGLALLLVICVFGALGTRQRNVKPRAALP